MYASSFGIACMRIRHASRKRQFVPPTIALDERINLIHYPRRENELPFDGSEGRIGHVNNVELALRVHRFRPQRIQ